MGNDSSLSLSLYAYVRMTKLKAHIATFCHLYLFRHKNKTHREMRANDYTKPCTCLRCPNENFCLLILFTCAVKIYSRAQHAYIESRSTISERSDSRIRFFIVISFRSLRIVYENPSNSIARKSYEFSFEVYSYDVH